MDPFSIFHEKININLFFDIVQPVFDWTEFVMASTFNIRRTDFS